MNPDVGRVGHSRSARCWPRRMNWTRRDSPVSPSAWYCDLCLKPRSTTLMDLPRAVAVAMISHSPGIAFSALIAVIRSEMVVNLILSGMSPLKVALSMSLYCAISLFICWNAQAFNLLASSSSFCPKKWYRQVCHSCLSLQPEGLHGSQTPVKTAPVRIRDNGSVVGI